MKQELVKTDPKYFNHSENQLSDKHLCIVVEFYFE